MPTSLDTLLERYLNVLQLLNSFFLGGGGITRYLMGGEEFALAHIYGIAARALSLSFLPPPLSLSRSLSFSLSLSANYLGVK